MRLFGGKASKNPNRKNFFVFFANLAYNIIDIYLMIFYIKYAAYAVKQQLLKINAQSKGETTK